MRNKAALIMPTGKRVIAHDTVNVRAARSGNYSPMIITIPKKIADVMKIKQGDSLRIYTDGERIYIDRFEESII